MAEAKTKIRAMIVRVEVITDKDQMLEGAPIVYSPIHGTASECFRQIADKFHQMAREDEEITRRLKEAEDSIMKKIQDDAWGKAGKA